MKKMYYLTYASHRTSFNGNKFITSSILGKSSDISKLQKILHDEYLRCCSDRSIMELNEAERDMDWFFEGYVDEICDEEHYGEDDKLSDGFYTLTSWLQEENDKDGDYMVEVFTWTKWFQNPEENENELSYLEIHDDDIEHVMLRIVSEDDIELVN